ncbi:trypsin-like peptidase domain-containing protein [Streptomyces sp. NPDC017890]|uniref:trypsin-like peptidase domain-containing protein n=1 Tax=Streptomyces sp. NPDC017890 TaxID=3365015 RepID=UPI0037A80831
MNEGKPTKAKWWSRPRSSEDATDGATDGDFALERPRTARTTGTGDDVADGGDFELERPVALRAADGGDGDYELEGPAAHRVADESDGDYELDRPAPETATGSAADNETPDTGAHTGVDDLDGSLSAGPVAERGKPLHDPDPYSTPPYGEPGPWAPAPPVQHPSATPAHGSVAHGSVAHGSVAHGTVAHGTPAHGTVATGAPPASGVPAAPSLSAPAGAVPDPALADAAPPALPVTPVPAGSASTPPGTGGDSPGADPWGRYDPWAAPAAAAPLQHSGTVAPTREQRRRRARKALAGGALLIALVSGGVGGAMGAYLERNGGVGTVELPQAGKEAVERAPDSVAGIADRALPGVVTLHVSGGDAAGTGTGFVLDDRGHILTNNHVVEPAGSGGEITVTFNSGDTAEATVVGRDGGYDLAVVKVKGVSGLTPMPLGNSDNVRVGDPVVAIGAPFDLAGTVTSGIISAKERPITAGGEEGDGSDVSYVDALQTDAPINPGNSGGPLLDAQGRVIGINSAIRSAGSGDAEPDGGQAGSIGLGFAIPINQGKRVAEELINTGRATHPVIGITLDMNYTGDGARVGAEGSDGGPAVTTGGPGAEAGIEPGDVITAVDGQRVHSGEELIVKTRAHRPGDRLELTLERDGKETNVSLVLGSSDG